MIKIRKKIHKQKYIFLFFKAKKLLIALTSVHSYNLLTKFLIIKNEKSMLVDFDC